MLSCTVVGLVNVANHTDRAASEAARAGASIGLVIGLLLLLGLWTLGAIVINSFRRAF
jgi:hypothetical protein